MCSGDKGKRYFGHFFGYDLMKWSSSESLIACAFSYYCYLLHAQKRFSVVCVVLFCLLD